MKTALVTGTSGFVGSAIGRHLRSLGWHVTGLSRRPSRADAADEDFRFDLTRALPRSLGRFDAVIHAAALSSPWAKPRAFTANIVTATRHLAKYAARTHPVRFIHISSGSVFYVDGDQTGIREDTHWHEPPINEYARAKRQAERVVTDRLHEAVILRPRAVYGPGDTVLFPRLLRAAKKGLLPRIVRPDGMSPRADLIYIGNLAHYVERALELPVTGAINLTDGVPVDINAMLADILTRLGYPPPSLRIPLPTAMRLAGAMEWVSAHLFGWAEPPLTRYSVSAVAHSKTFDVTKMRETMGPPPFTTEQGIAAFVAWQKDGAPL